MKKRSNLPLILGLAIRTGQVSSHTLLNLGWPEKTASANLSQIATRGLIVVDTHVDTPSGKQLTIYAASPAGREWFADWLAETNATLEQVGQG